MAPTALAYKRQLDGLKVTARALAEALPACPYAERTVTHVLVEERPADWRLMWQHTAMLQVTAVYTPWQEKTLLLNPAWASMQNWRVKGYVYELHDARRGAHNRHLQLSEDAALRVLAGETLPELPLPGPEGEDLIRDPFEPVRKAVAS